MEASGVSPAIAVERLSFRYPGGQPALREISLRVMPSEAVCLAGPNGAGKSTLLLCLAGLLEGSGVVRINGASPSAANRVGLVFQDPDDQLFLATVAEDVAFGPRNQRLSESVVAGRVQAALAATGLVGFETRRPHELSAGEKKRVTLAGVLAMAPAILALDEPWANLDARGARAVTSIIRSFTGTRLIATHDIHHAALVCSRMVILDAGQIVADGPTRKLLADPALLEHHGIEFDRRCRDCPAASVRETEETTDEHKGSSGVQEFRSSGVQLLNSPTLKLPNSLDI
jgi:energy-coupling factor transporter ATP-binding protein EcfA2